MNELTASTSFSGCTAFGFASADIKTNGCTETFTTATKIKVGEVTWGKEQVHLVCPGSNKIEITPTSFGVSVCTQSIAAQTHGPHIIATNTGGSGNTMDVTLDYTFTEISYTGTGGACGTSGTNATFNASLTLRAYADAAHTIQRGITTD